MRIVIAEDSAVLRAGLIELLMDRRHDVVAAVSDGEALQAAVAEHLPDIVVVDVRMPPTHTDEGLRAAVEIRRRHPDIAVLVFSQYIETSYAAQLFGPRRPPWVEWVTCSRTALPTSANSWRRSNGLAAAAPR